MKFNCKFFSLYHDFEFSIFIFYFSDFQQVMVCVLVILFCIFSVSFCVYVFVVLRKCP